MTRAFGIQSDNQAYKDAEAYALDPANEFVPEQSHQEYDQGLVSHNTKVIGELSTRSTDLEATAPTVDQKAALDGASGANAGNPIATLADITSGLSSAGAAFTFKTATGAPAQGEIRLDNADPSLATIARVSNVDASAVNRSNLFLNIGAEDALVIQNLTDGGEVYNYDVSGSPTQVGGTGPTGYVEVPVTFFSQGVTPIPDSTASTVMLMFDGNNTRFMQKSANLSDLASVATARTNLSVYSISEVDGLLSAQGSSIADLSGVTDAATARTNLDVYSTAEVDAAIAGGSVDISGLMVKANNLSDLTNLVTARNNLQVYSKADIDGANLSTLTNIATARTNLDVYSVAQVDSGLALKATLTSNLADLPNKVTARTNLSVYSIAEVDSLIAGAGGGDMLASNNLSELTNLTTARTNLGVYSTGEVDSADALRCLKTSNLSDLANAATARTNLDVYSTGEVDSAVGAKMNSTGGTSTTQTLNWGNFTLDYDGVNDRIRISYSATEVFQLHNDGTLKAKAFEVLA